MRKILLSLMLAMGVCMAQTPASADQPLAPHSMPHGNPPIHGIIIRHHPPIHGVIVRPHPIRGIIIRHRVCRAWEVFGAEKHCVKWVVVR